MKLRHKEHARVDARAILISCNIKRGQDFDTLQASQVDALLVYADLRRYQKPKNANGSRGRYFHDRIQRLAKSV